MSDLPDIPKEAILITHGYEGLGGGISGKMGTIYFPYQGKADRKGVLTIGRGHVLTPKEKESGTIHVAERWLNTGHGITLAEVDQLFTQDMAPRLIRTRGYMPGANDHELGAGLSLVYNCEVAMSVGTPGRAWRGGNKLKCAAGFLLYVMSAGKPQLGLWRRRMTEALCFLTGEVLIAKEPQAEALLHSKLEALSVIQVASQIAHEQGMRQPWLKHP
jgi:GH24 family phage-related lysozyme (muramidase)